MERKKEKRFGYEMADPLLYDKLKRFASEHRRNPTETESILWNYLKGKQTGYSFRRQHIIGSYIADFSCLSHSLLIEIDGGYHQLPEQQISDEYRTEWLENKGFHVMRFTNEEVTGDTEKVINTIKQHLINERT